MFLFPHGGLNSRLRGQFVFKVRRIEIHKTFITDLRQLGRRFRPAAGLVSFKERWISPLYLSSPACDIKAGYVPVARQNALPQFFRFELQTIQANTLGHLTSAARGDLMKYKELYDYIINAGISSDPRGTDTVKIELGRKKINYDKLDSTAKSRYDAEKLSNPYMDTRMLNGTGNEEVKTILIGIDIDAAELLLAKQLGDSGSKIDLVVSHHPSGYAYANFYEVMGMQSDILAKFGVPINVAEGLLAKRMKEVANRVMPANHTRAVDAAKLLGLPFMCAHTVADNHVAKYLQERFDAAKAYYVEDVVKLLKKIPEYDAAELTTVGPKVVVGREENRSGRVFVDMTGGTEGAVEIIEKLSAAGVGTIVGMHMSEEHLKNAEKYNINVVIAGHISSDNLGLNLLFDKVENKFGPLNLIACSGFRRIKHNE